MRVVLVAAQGYYRDGLVALLRILPEVEVACLDTDKAVREWPFVQAPNLVIFDGDSMSASLNSVRERWSSARILVLVDRLGMKLNGDLSGVDGILSKSLSAGEFLSSVGRNVDDCLVIDYRDVNLATQAEVW